MKNLSPDQKKRLQARAVRKAKKYSSLMKSGEVQIDAAQAAFSSLLQRYRAVGGALSVVKNGQTILTLTHGIARKQGNVAVDESTVFRCASVSKLALTLGILKLTCEGRLDLDEDISLVLGYSVRSPYHRDVPITMRQLLTHTAAISDGGAYASGNLTVKALLHDKPIGNFLPQAPGESFAYSNFGAGVAGCMLELVTGERLDRYMCREIFTPLGIGATFAPQTIADSSRIADGYHVKHFAPARMAYDALALADAPLAPFNPERDYQIAPGRMLASSGELAKILQLFLSDGMDILPPEVMHDMRACQDAHGSVKSAGRGLNTAFLHDIWPVPLVGHQGVAYGMCCELWGDVATQSGIVFQTNGALLSRGRGLMGVGFDAISLGMALLGY